MGGHWQTTESRLALTRCRWIWLPRRAAAQFRYNRRATSVRVASSLIQGAIEPEEERASERRGTHALGSANGPLMDR